MKEFFIVAVLVIAVLSLLYILYINGFAIINTKSALFYMCYPRFCRRKNSIEEKFISCSGSIKRVICLSRSKKYRFVFSSSVTKGSVYFEIYGAKKKLIAILNDENPCEFISGEQGTRLRVVTKFKNADGESKLIWDEA